MKKFLVLCLLGACAGSDSAKSSCIPGQSVACTGPAGCAGGQICDSTGKAFNACVCGVTDGGNQDSDAQPEVQRDSKGSADSKPGYGPDASADSAVDAVDAQCFRILNPGHPTGFEGWNCEGCFSRPGGPPATDTEGWNCADSTGRFGVCHYVLANMTHPAYQVCCAGCWDENQTFCRPVTDPSACGGGLCGTSSSCMSSL